MKNIIKTLFVSLFILLPTKMSAVAPIDIYFFYGDGCPHCAKEEVFLDKIEAENKDIKTHRYEVWNNRANQKLLSELGKKYDWNVSGVPFTVVGDKTFVGFQDEETSGQQIINAVEFYRAGGYSDLVGQYLRDENNSKNKEEKNNYKLPEKISLPFFGQMSVKNFSLPVLTIVIAALDGFNPCALWILIFLITLLIGLKERKKLIILGCAFILTSAVFYFLVLSAWLNLLLFIGFIKWIRIAIGLVAIYAGYYNLKEYIVNKDKSCEVTDDNKKKETFIRVKNIVSEQSLYLALGGIVILAVSVNALELVCSAGLPAVYTQILAMSGLAKWQYYGYLLLYTFIFVLNQIVIFSVAMFTFRLQAINPKVLRVITVVGGVIMLVLGALMIFKPSWIMFG